MTKPDRLTKLKRFDQYRQGGVYDFMLPNDFGPWVKFDDAKRLLRREQQRVRRIITAHKHKAARERVSYYGLTIDCCNDLLEKLKGKP